MPIRTISPEKREVICARHAQGARPRELAAEFGVSDTHIRRIVDPDYAERQRLGANVSAKRKYASDPVYRARARDRVRACLAKNPHTPEQRKRWSLRAYARQEAAETGEPVEQVYERWGVA